MISSALSFTFLPISIIISLLSVRGLVDALPDHINIGGLFEADEDEQKLVFRYALDTINEERTILPRTNLRGLVEHVDRDDSFNVDKKVCGLLQTGVAAIIGPSSSTTSMHVQSICDVFDIPHIETRWDSALQQPEISINLHPHPSVLALAFLDLVKYLQWKHFCVVYEDYDGLIRLQSFLKRASDEWKIRFYRFSYGKPYRDTYWEIKKRGETNIILDVRAENVNKALKHAQQVGLITENHSYILTSLDLNIVDLEDYKFSKARITSFRIVDDTSPDVMELKDKWSDLVSRSPDRSKLPSSLRDLRTESALIFDAMKLIAHGIKSLDRVQTIEVNPIACNSNKLWHNGASLFNQMKELTFNGMTGKVTFDKASYRRTSFTLSVMAVIPKNDSDFMDSAEEGLQRIGTWTIEGGNHSLEISVTGKNILFGRSGSKSQQVYRIVTLLSDPYAMLKSSNDDKHGNDRYEGFALDLAEELSKLGGWKYQFQQVKDMAYGAFNETSQSWNGMIGEIVRGEADMAIADLTITSQRETVVDFSHPFMNTGISILFRKPTKKANTLFSFLSPFSMVVWVYVVGAYVGVSVVLFVVGRLSPYEWDNPHPCRQDDQVLENEFSLLNSFWFTIGSLMQQGSDLTPKSMSSRTIAAIWYFFTLIMISSYTANLAAFLTVEKVVSPIEDAKDLASQNEILYGCVATGSTRAFFKGTQIEEYRKMFRKMEKNPHVYVKNNMEGKLRAIRGNYAFFMESAAIEFIVERECNLTQIGSLLDSKGYGIATRMNSQLTRILSEGVLRLQELGVLQVLKDRWWKQKKGGGACLEDSKKGSSSVTELSLGNVGGVFVVLLAGLAFSLFTAVCEFMWRARKNSRNRQSMGKEIWRDLKFALSCQSSTKSVRPQNTNFVGPNTGMIEKMPPSPQARFMTNY